MSNQKWILHRVVVLNDQTDAIAWYDTEKEANDAMFELQGISARFRRKCEKVGAITKTGFIDPNHVHFPLILEWYEGEMRKYDPEFTWGSTEYFIKPVRMGYTEAHTDANKPQCECH